MRSVLNNNIDRNRSTSRTRSTSRSQSSCSIRSNSKGLSSKESQSLSITNATKTKSSIDQNSNAARKSNESDYTDTDIDENNRLLNERFKNKSKTKYLECRHLFTIEFINKKQTAKCNLCQKPITMSSNSDSNLRTHLGYLHDKTEFLTPSQLKRYNGINSKQERISREEKLE